jgi:S-formylglutathione hydrolase
MTTHWQTEDVAGRPARIFRPPAPPRGVVLFLSDLAGPVPDLSPDLTAHALAAVIPAGGESAWTDRRWPPFDPERSAEDYLLNEVLPYALSLAPQLALAGLGVGGQAALRLAFRDRLRFPVVGALRPAIDWQDLHGHGTVLDELYPTAERCRQDSAVLHVPQTMSHSRIWFACPPGDVWWRGCDRLREKLRALGIEHTADLAPRGATPPTVYAELMAGPMMQFLAEGLTRRGRSLL